MEMANVVYKDGLGAIKTSVAYSMCINCGRCISACKHNARYYVSDTERFFSDLANGREIAVIAAPSIRTNLPEYKKLFTYLKKLGVQKIYDGSYGADICTWAHVRTIENNPDVMPMLTQPCPAIVNYCKIYHHDLLKKLSPIHSPIACTSIILKKYEHFTGSIAAITPCLAKSAEFDDTQLAQYNITFDHLLEYIEKNEIILPEEETEFDNDESGMGSLFPMPGGLKENIEYMLGQNVHIMTAEGKDVFEELNKFAVLDAQSMPDILDALNCKGGCNMGPAQAENRNEFHISKRMHGKRQRVHQRFSKEFYIKQYQEYDRKFDLKDFLRTYEPIMNTTPHIGDADIDHAFYLLGKNTKAEHHVDCGACGSDTCYNMARKIALNVNIPANCIIKSKEDARLEHEENMRAHQQLMELEKKQEADERVRKIVDEASRAMELQLSKLNMVIKATNIGLWEMQVIKKDPINPANVIQWSNEFRAILGYENEDEFPNVLGVLSSHLHPEDKAKTYRALLNHLMDRQGKTIFDAEFRLSQKNGEYAYIHAFGDTIRDESGNPERFVGALIDLTQINNLMQEAERERQTAEQANRAKSEFLSHISHEIRTPMNAVLGAAEIQLQKDDIPPDTEEAFNMIHNSGSLLLGIINDILDLSKIEAGKLELVPDKYEIPSLLYDSMQRNLLRYENKQIEFVLDVDETTPLDLYGDELRIKQILNNVLSNAFKYTDKGRIVFSVSHEPLTDVVDDLDVNCVIVFGVKDTGQGMNEEQIERLFDQYTRFNMDVNRTTVGTGLGMNITKRFVDMMHGEISVTSKPGVGTEFIIKLPMKRISEHECGPELAARLSSNSFQGLNNLKKTHTTYEFMPYGSVLVVDDIASNIYVAKGMLMPYGLKVDSAASGFEALNKIRDGRQYDIIFMDHMMPKMDGIEAVKQIRELGYHKPIIALTANAVTGQADMFMNKGFNGFVSKPIDVRELSAVLNRFVRDKQPPEVIAAARKEAGQHKTNSTSEIGLDAHTHIMDAAYTDIVHGLHVLHPIKIDTDEGLKTFQTTIHGLKSALLNIHEKIISDKAARLEVFAKNKNIVGIHEHISEFVCDVENLCAQYESDKVAASLNTINPSEAETKQETNITLMPYGSVMVVDDVSSNLYLVEAMLEPYLVETVLVDSGQGALEIIKGGRVFDVIFMDHMMPDLDGVETVLAMRQFGYEGIIIALTANMEDNIEAMFLSHGFDGFIAKPIDLKEIDAALKKHIRDKYDACDH